LREKVSAPCGIEGKPLEVHVPKAARSIRRFAVELVTIVAGIIIAISSEQVVEAPHRHEKANTVREAPRRELQEADGFNAFRVAVNDCLAQRLSQLNEIAEAAADHKEIERVGDLTLHVGHLLSDDGWQSERAAQTLVHFPAIERERYSRTHGQQLDIRAWMNEELGVWAAIRILQGNPNRLSSGDLTVIRQNIQIARVLNYLIVKNGGRPAGEGVSAGNPQGQSAYRRGSGVLCTVETCGSVAAVHDLLMSHDAPAEST
jgi:hypothetical protein